MKTIDMRFDQNVVRKMIGQRFQKYRCDPFVFTKSVTQIVGFYIGDEVFKLTNIQETVDYYGITDDIAVFRIEPSEDTEIQSAFVEVKQIDTPVNGIIDRIILVNERQQVFQNNEQTYDVWLTRGIIFEVDGREISFEKQNIPFSEEIDILRGYELIEKYSNVKDFSEGWDPGVRAVATREIVTIN